MRRIALRKEVIQAFKRAFPSLVQPDLRPSSMPGEPIFYEDEKYQVGFSFEPQGVVLRWVDRKTDTGYGALIIVASQIAFHLKEGPKIFHQRQTVFAKVARVFGKDTKVDFQHNTSIISVLTVPDSERLQLLLNPKSEALKEEVHHA